MCGARTGGSILLQHGQPLTAFEPSLLKQLSRNAARHPTKVAYARRGAGGAVAGTPWETLSFGELEPRVRRIAGWFLDRNMGGEVLLLLTGNSLNHALLRLGAIGAGVIVCPVSAGYIAAGGDFARLAYVRDLLNPRLLFAERAVDIAAAAPLFAGRDCHLICADPQGALLPQVTALEELEAAPTLRDDALADPDAPAVYMLTSGSTGRPKAVPQSQRMILSNLHQAQQILGAAAGWSEHMLDWLPWSHVSGAFNLYAAATFGASLYIDDGKPMPGLFDETLANLREIPLPYFCNVPIGYGMLATALRDDPKLRERFFEQLRLMLYGGAGLSQPVSDALQEMAVECTGHRIMMTTGYGLTESSSGCMAIYFPTDQVGIGLPLPGVETRLVPLGDERFEIRLRGPNVMSAYLNNSEASAAAFDEDGYFRTGDAARFHDRDDPQAGLAYAGRLVEEFKLSSGTWVRSGSVRAEILAALAPAVGDLLLCGVNAPFLAALAVPNIRGLQSISGLSTEDPALLCASPSVLALLRERLTVYNRRFPGSSTALRRFAFMVGPPDPQRHEISDKGTINQRIAADNRADEIARLYASPADASVLVIPVG